MIIILVAPQMGENIGAVARIMKNFNMKELRIVSPRDGWPNVKAEAVAAFAIDILHNAIIYDNLNSAISDLEYLYATSSEQRNMNKEYILSDQLAFDYSDNLKTAIMFGRENCGLNNQEIALANKIITIESCESLNIAQSIAIICYELRIKRKVGSILNEQQCATKQNMDYFYIHLFTELEKANFFKVKEKKVLMKQNIMNLFNRIEKLSITELQTLRGIISALTNRR